MTAAVGHPTLRLVRVGVGPILFGGLLSGEWRELEPAEVELLRTVRDERSAGWARPKRP